MPQEPLHIVDGHIYAYLLIHSQSKEILDGNLLARSFYKKGNSFPPLEELFSPELGEASIHTIADTLNTEGSTMIEYITSTKCNGEPFPCHIEICKVNDHLIFLVIKEVCHQLDSKMKDLVDLIGNPIFVLEHDEPLTAAYGNPRCYQCFPLDKQRFQKEKHSSFLELLPEEKRLVFLQTVNHELGQHGECDVDVELDLNTNHFQLFRFNAFQSTFDGRLYGVLISAKQQRDLMKKIEYDQQYFDIMQRYSKDLLFRIDVKNHTLVHRGDISKFVGLTPEVTNFPESIRDTRWVHPDDLEGYVAFAYRLINGMEACFEPRFHFANGTFERYRLQGSPLFDNQGTVVQIVGKSENIQKYVEIEAKANYDALTTTLNKQSFREIVEDIIQNAVDSDKFALLFIDMDDFKGVNDKMGHVFGDFLLEAMGKRILNCTRSQDKVGRVGGDEFVVFFQFAPSHESVLERAEAILHSLRREFTYVDKSYKTKASIGIAMYPEHGKNYELLYHRADKALYESKYLGKDVATVYFDELD